MSSKFCRAIETTELLDLTPVINKTEDVSEGGMIVSPDETDRRADALRTLVSTQPANGKNTIVVTHQLNMVEAFGPTFLDVSEAEFIIFKPNSDGFKQLWRVRPIDISLWRDSIALK